MDLTEFDMREIEEAMTDPDITEYAGVPFANLVELINRVTDAELESFDESAATPEALRELIEKIALITGLACLQVTAQEPPAMVLSFDRDQAVQMFAQLMHSQGVSIHLNVE